MDLFSDFCNICCKISNEPLNNICDGNQEHLKDILITFVGHSEVDKNKIYLCRFCCEELVRFKDFKEMCFRNFVELRQMYINMKAKLELEEDTDTVTNIMKEFLHGEVFRNNSLGKSNSLCLLSTDLQETVKDSGYKQKQLSGIKRVESGYICTDISVINKNECVDSHIEFTEELLNSNNENIKLEGTQIEASASEDFGLKYFENDCGVNFVYDVSNTNNSNGCGSSPVQFPIEKLRTEIGTLENTSDFETESDEDFDLSNISNGSDTSQDEFTREESSTSNMEDCVEKDIKIEENLKVRMKLRSRGCKGKSNAETVSTQEFSLHASEHCNRSCPTTPESVIHAHANSHAESCTCAVCHEAVADTSTLTKQELNHSDGRSYQCTVCDKVVTTASSLTKHERIHSGIKPYKCNVCDKAFADSSNLTKHERIHTGAKPFKCSVCEKAFADPSSLTQHKHIHSSERPHKCTLCNKTFKYTTSLTIHTRIHNGITPYKCSYCNKAFIVSSSLITHERIHTGVKPYKCSSCNKAFRDSSSLVKHERIHSGVRPYKCNVCNKAFAGSGCLVKHQRIHSGSKPYKCTDCNIAFAQISNLYRHKRRQRCTE